MIIYNVQMNYSRLIQCNNQRKDDIYIEVVLYMGGNNNEKED